MKYYGGGLLTGIVPPRKKDRGIATYCKYYGGGLIPGTCSSVEGVSSLLEKLLDITVVRMFLR